MVRFLLAILCITSTVLHAPRLSEWYKEIARQKICDMDFWCNGQWVKAVEVVWNRIEVQINPESNFTFAISDEKLQELFEEVNSPDPKTFKGNELFADYPNILQYMEVKVEQRSFPGFIKGKLYSLCKRTKYQPKYFAIALNLPEMEVDMGNLLIQRFVNGAGVPGDFNLVRKQKIRIGEPFVLCTSPLNSGSPLCNACHRLAGNKWMCALRLWKAEVINDLLDQRPESQISIDYIYNDIYLPIHRMYAYELINPTFKVPLVLKKNTDAEGIKVRVKFHRFPTLPFYHDGEGVPIKLFLTYRNQAVR